MNKREQLENIIQYAAHRILTTPNIGSMYKAYNSLRQFVAVSHALGYITEDEKFMLIGNLKEYKHLALCDFKKLN